MPKALPLADRYGFLTVLGRAKGGVHCRCDCGRESFPKVQSVRSGVTKSCGKCGVLKRRVNPHPNWRSAEYGVWVGLKRRCLDPRVTAYRDYGGRGITVCEAWLRGADGLKPFETFKRDMGPRPSSRHSIDRIDNTKGYSPENCRWATDKEQSRNRRGNLLVTYRGETLCLSEMCEKHGKPVDRVWQRLHLFGWTIVDAMETPPKSGKDRPHQ